MTEAVRSNKAIVEVCPPKQPGCSDGSFAAPLEVWCGPWTHSKVQQGYMRTLQAVGVPLRLPSKWVAGRVRPACACRPVEMGQAPSMPFSGLFFQIGPGQAPSRHPAGTAWARTCALQAFGASCGFLLSGPRATSPSQQRQI